jgi:hypothetical protein
VRTSSVHTGVGTMKLSKGLFVGPAGRASEWNGKWNTRHEVPKIGPNSPQQPHGPSGLRIRCMARDQRKLLVTDAVDIGPGPRKVPSKPVRPLTGPGGFDSFRLRYLRKRIALGCVSNCQIGICAKFAPLAGTKRA